MEDQDLNRSATRSRKTAETDIKLTLNLDGSGKARCQTGIPFFDHMLTLFARHGCFDLEVEAVGDLDVDYHHTVEDTGIALGQAVKEALGDKAGIRRYGFFILPMDECLARVAIDLSNRPLMVYRVEAPSLMVRDFNILLVREFFQAFTSNVGANLHLHLEYGTDPHHIAECLFKTFARALDQATSLDPRLKGQIPSTKESLT